MTMFTDTPSSLNSALAQRFLFKSYNGQMCARDARTHCRLGRADAGQDYLNQSNSEELRLNPQRLQDFELLPLYALVKPDNLRFNTDKRNHHDQKTLFVLCGMSSVTIDRLLPLRRYDNHIRVAIRPSVLTNV